MADFKDGCIFCEIIQGNAPGSVAYEDEVVMVIMDIAPVTDGHAMVIPKAHAANLAALDEATGMHLFKIAQRTAAALRESGLRCEGINLFLADGEAAFQEVFHVHLHVFPRYAGDSFKIDADWDRNPPRHALDAAAGQLRAAYERLWATSS